MNLSHSFVYFINTSYFEKFFLSQASSRRGNPHPNLSTIFRYSNALFFSIYSENKNLSSLIHSRCHTALIHALPRSIHLVKKYFENRINNSSSRSTGLVRKSLMRLFIEFSTILPMPSVKYRSSIGFFVCLRKTIVIKLLNTKKVIITHISHK